MDSTRSPNADADAQYQHGQQPIPQPQAAHEQHRSHAADKAAQGPFPGLLGTDFGSQFCLAPKPSSKIGKGIAGPGGKHHHPQKGFSQAHGAPHRNGMHRSCNFPQQDKMGKRKAQIDQGHAGKSYLLRPMAFLIEIKTFQHYQKGKQGHQGQQQCFNSQAGRQYQESRTQAARQGIDLKASRLEHPGKFPPAHQAQQQHPGRKKQTTHFNQKQSNGNGHNRSSYSLSHVRLLCLG